MENIVQDVSKISTIQTKYLNKLNDIYLYCILESVQEAILRNDTYCELDLGLGQLLINFDNNELKFKFKPSQKLKTEVISTIKNNKNLLEIELEKSLIEKLTKLYKEII